MKIKQAFLMVAALIALAVCGYFYVRNRPANPPPRPSSVPKNAEWAGGSEGGNWYEIARVISKTAFKIRIYSDQDGVLEADTTFTLSGDCGIGELDSSELRRSINGYDGARILLRFREQAKGCSLVVK